MKTYIKNILDKAKQLIKENSNLLGLLCLFIIIQPFFDTVQFFENENLTIFGFTIPTIIRCIVIFVLGLLSIKYIDKKHYKYIIIYIGILLVYTLCHHIVCSSSDIIIPERYNYSITSELFYIIRMLLPLAIVIFTKSSNITKEKFLKTLTISGAIIGTIIFIGNTFCISYVSYGKGITVVNWIQWFFGDLSEYDFNLLTSKGWFFMANQVSGVMVLLFPFCVYSAIKHNNFVNLYGAIILLIGMIMLGTRVASFGALLILISLIIGIIVLSMLYKHIKSRKKELLTISTITIVAIVFLIFSPVAHRTYGYSLGDINSLEEKPEIDFSDLESLEQAYRYIENNYEIFKIQKVYIYDLYSYKFDPKFWFDIFEYSIENGVIENREMQRLISSKIDTLNNSKLKYKLLGYSFSRMRNGQIYMEHDILVQAYTMGYIGLILLIGPYVAIIAVVVIRILKSKKIRLIDITFFLATGACILSGIFAGHVLDELFVTIYLGFICGYFLKDITNNRKTKVKT